MEYLNFNFEHIPKTRFVQVSAKRGITFEIWEMVPGERWVTSSVTTFIQKLF